MNNINEKRKKNRVPFETDVVLITDDTKINIKGSSKDLSLNGMSVYTKEHISVDIKCKVEITLTGVNAPVSLDIAGTIVRKDEDRLAIKFDAIDLESYSYLNNILEHNTVDFDEFDNKN